MRGHLFKSGYFPMRVIIWIQIFTCCLICYMLRVNISINIIAMVQPTGNTTKSENGTIEKQKTPPDYGPRYHWNADEQAHVLGSYYWGYIWTSIPGAFLAERYGPARTIFVVSVLSGVLTLLTPVCAAWHYSAVIVNRIVLGLFGGVIYPALHCLISKWAPPIEKGKFIGALLGGNLGTVLTWPIMGAIIESWNWQWSFYGPGILTLVWCVLWFFFTADTPEQHRYINKKETLYIKTCIGSHLSKKRKVPPYWSMAKSLPFWSLTILHFGNLWGLYFILTVGPKFVSEVLGFNLTKSGIYSALPNLARIVVGFAAGSLGDYIRIHKWMTVTWVRKFFILFSHILPGLFVLGQTFIGENATWAIVLMTLALGSNGASTLTNLQNSQDLSPNFAGTIYGIMNCIGGVTGFINPAITAAFIKKSSSTAKEWYPIFYIGSSVYIACGIFFIFFGTGKLQAWNVIPEDPADADAATSDGVTNEGFQGDKDKPESTKV